MPRFEVRLIEPYSPDKKMLDISARSSFKQSQGDDSPLKVHSLAVSQAEDKVDLSQAVMPDLVVAAGAGAAGAGQAKVDDKFMQKSEIVQSVFG